MTDYASTIGTDFKLHCWSYTKGATVVTYTNHDSEGASPTYQVETAPKFATPRDYIHTMCKNVGVWPVPADFWKVSA